MAIQFIAQTGNQTGGSHTHTLPASVLDGDLLVWFENGVSGNTNVTPPPGWSHIDESPWVAPPAWANGHSNLMWRVAGETDASATQLFTTSVGTLGASRIFVFRNTEGPFIKNGSPPWTNLTFIARDQPDEFRALSVTGDNGEHVVAFGFFSSGAPTGVSKSFEVGGWSLLWTEYAQPLHGLTVNSKELTLLDVPYPGYIDYDPNTDGVGACGAWMVTFSQNQYVDLGEPDGYGNCSYGGMSWGSLEDTPLIDALSPEADEAGASLAGTIRVRLRDRTGIDLSTFYLLVDGIPYVENGVAQNGATVSYEANSFYGYDATITLPDEFVNGDTPQVTVQVSNVCEETYDRLYTFTVGLKLRIVAIENPFEGTLLVHFSEPMLQNDEFFKASNWKVRPISAGALPLTITGVSGNSVRPQTATLSYIGGGSEYELEVFNTEGLNGTPYEYRGNIALFDLIFGTEGDFEVTLFDSIYGPLGIARREILRRTMDDHTADRALSLAMDEQFRLRLQILDATAGRSGKPGKLRS